MRRHSVDEEHGGSSSGAGGGVVSQEMVELSDDGHFHHKSGEKAPALETPSSGGEIPWYRIMLLGGVVLVAVLLLYGLTQIRDIKDMVKELNSTQDDPQAPPAEVLAFRDAMIASMDTSVDPCQDFYEYSCGGWINSTTLPGDRSRWVRSFDTINESNLKTLFDILQTNPWPVIGPFFHSCMDVSTINSLGMAPLTNTLQQIGALGAVGAKSVWEVMGELMQAGVATPISIYVDADFQNPQYNVAFIGQGGLGMPDRDYYLNEGAAMQQLRSQYVSHLTKLLTLLEDMDANAAGAKAQEVMQFEAKLASISIPNDQLRDPDAVYNKRTLDELQTSTPFIFWEALLSAAGYPVDSSAPVIVESPTYLEQLDALLSNTDLQVLSTYFTLRLLESYSAELPSAFADEAFDWSSKISGVKSPPTRWKTCVQLTDRYLGEMVGRLYIQEKFPGNSKEIAVKMIENIEQAFARDFRTLSWMDATTAERAIGKLDTIINKIGYPDAWEDYAELTPLIRNGEWLASNRAARQFHWAKAMEEVGKKVSPTKWYMTPSTVNAYYNPMQNEIAFPAGILQNPFFNAEFPPAANLGGIGVVVGHEISHGFDDSGRKFNASGHLVPWWSPQVVENFQAKADCVADFYSQYTVNQDGGEKLNVNGRLTLGENIADMGGVRMSLAAYRAGGYSGSDAPAAESLVPNLTNEQMFFVSFAQIWCAKQTPQALRKQILTDPHSPSKFRVNGPLSNSEEFAQVFQCPANSPMNPSKKCQVW